MRIEVANRADGVRLDLLSGGNRFRVGTGSANLSVAALSGWQKEIYIAFDGENAYREFESLYKRDLRCSNKPEYLVELASNGAPLKPGIDPVRPTEVPKFLACKCARRASQFSKSGRSPRLRGSI